jgi:hypothetical protein
MRRDTATSRIDVSSFVSKLLEEDDMDVSRWRARPCPGADGDQGLRQIGAAAYADQFGDNWMTARSSTSQSVKRGTGLRGAL